MAAAFTQFLRWFQFCSAAAAGWWKPGSPDCPPPPPIDKSLISLRLHFTRTASRPWNNMTYDLASVSAFRCEAPRLQTYYFSLWCFSFNINTSYDEFIHAYHDAWCYTWYYHLRRQRCALAMGEIATFISMKLPGLYAMDMGGIMLATIYTTDGPRNCTPERQYRAIV